MNMLIYINKGINMISSQISSMIMKSSLNLDNNKNNNQNNSSNNLKIDNIKEGHSINLHEIKIENTF